MPHVLKYHLKGYCPTLALHDSAALAREDILPFFSTQNATRSRAPPKRARLGCTRFSTAQNIEATLCSAGARRKRLCGDLEAEPRWVQHDIALRDSYRAKRCTDAQFRKPPQTVSSWVRISSRKPGPAGPACRTVVRGAPGGCKAPRSGSPSPDPLTA